VEEVSLLATDGTRLHGWLQKPAGRSRFPLVIVFGSAVREVSPLLTRDKPPEWGWLMVNYRGFGLSEGQPTESQVSADARLIFDHAAARADIDSSRIVVLGRSIGSAVATMLAAERPVAGVILGTPFANLQEIAELRYPALPSAFLVGGRYDALARAPAIRQPALFLIAGEDQVTPPASGERLAKAWGGSTRVIRLAGASHYSAERRLEYWSAIDRFLDEMNR